MASKFTTEEWIKKAKEVHGDKYDYSFSEYKGSKNDINIYCKIHNKIFTQKAGEHLQGYGCNKCAKELQIKNNPNTITLEKFLQRAELIHSDKYDYSLVTNIKSGQDTVSIICKKHNYTFTQKVKNHLLGYGCKICGNEKGQEFNRDTTESFIEKAKKIYGEKYSYKGVAYIDTNTPIIVTCKEEGHGPFIVTPNVFLNSKAGCPKCNGKKITLERFLKEATVIHKGFYDYSKVLFTKRDARVEIICPIHGSFYRRADYHMYGSKCPECNKDAMRQARCINTEEFIRRAKLVHGEDRYNYTNTEYKNSRSKVSIVCTKEGHGEFDQEAASHLQGFGCPKCNYSRGERLVQLFLEKNNIKYVSQESFKNTENPCRNPTNSYLLYFDFYLPDYKKILEIDGIQHYEPVERFGGGEKFEIQKYKDSVKNKYCEDNDIQLVRIPYWDIDKIEEILTKELGLNNA